MVLIGVVVAACGSIVGGDRASADEDVVFVAGDSAPSISLIGDSTLAGVRWYADYGPLRQFNFVLNAESCRRTIERSCFSREGYRSANVVATMEALDGRLGEVLVVMSGYNDALEAIEDAIDQVVDAARSQDVEHVVWLTLRTSSDVDYSDPQEQSSINTFRDDNARLTDAAADSDGFLQVADWATYSTGAGDWFEYDGVHLTPSGVDAAVDTPDATELDTETSTGLPTWVVVIGIVVALVAAVTLRRRQVVARRRRRDEVISARAAAARDMPRV